MCHGVLYFLKKWASICASILCVKIFELPNPDDTRRPFPLIRACTVYEVKAHKMILGMVSLTFKTMFYITDVGDKTSEMIHILETTALAFQIVIDAIYHSKGSLQKKTVKVGKWSKLRLTPPPPSPARFGLLNCYIFFVYLALVDHEMYFEQNLYIFPHKSGLTLRKMFAFFLMFIL